MRRNSMDKIDAVKQVICSVLNCESIELSESTDIRKIDGYDSLNHIKIVLEIEEMFSINIPLSSVDSIKTISDIINIANQ